MDLDGTRIKIRSEETNEGNLVADALLWQANALAAGFGLSPAQVGIQNGGGIRNDAIIPAGPFSELSTFDILPFSNLVAIVPDFPREQFKELLENAVSARRSRRRAVRAGGGLRLHLGSRWYSTSPG